MCVSASSFTSAAAASSAAPRAVAWRRLLGPRGVLLRERRLVHQQVGPPGHGRRHLAGRAVPGDHHPASPARVAEHLFGRHLPHRLASLQAPESGPGFTPSSIARASSNRPGRSSSTSAYPRAGDPVLDRERRDRVLLPAQLVAGAPAPPGRSRRAAGRSAAPVPRRGGAGPPGRRCAAAPRAPASRRS